MNNQIKCDYCGKVKEDGSFYIGASDHPDWVMVEGTGFISCPQCYPKAKEDGKKAISDYVHAFNNS